MSRFFFIVQGEGRGHMTQAIALSHMLREAGHNIVQVVVGKSPQRNIPDYFFQQIGAPVQLLESPNFVTDKDHKTVKVFRTIVYSFLNSPKYRNSIQLLAELVRKTQPDVILNFYDFLGGLYNFLHRPRVPFICLAHQYLMAHPDFNFPEGQLLSRTSLLMGNRITQLGADKVLALSFRSMQDLPVKKLHVVPPLLRKEIKKVNVTDRGHVLVYMVNPGYGKEVEKFHQHFPDQRIEVFWDHPKKPAEWKVSDTLVFHQLNDKKFLDLMSSCKAYITTAGFESVCEAMYLGKPVMMVPVQGHFEQSCNAIDAEKAGAGVAHHEFDFKVLLDYLPRHQGVSTWFRDWADQNKTVFLRYLQA